MKSKAIFMALLALTFTAQAVPVSVDDAKAVARAWSRQGRHLKARIGTQVEDVSSVTTVNGAQFHVVRMAGGGSVITSSDTEVEPIVAFTSETVDAAALDPEGPLYALLNRDLSVRRNALSAAGLAYGPTAYAARLSRAAAENANKWAALIAAGAETRNPLLAYGLDAAAVTAPSDVRVDALMKTKWSQGDGIWNSCTYKHYICGCVATAASQVMRYLHGTPDEDGLGGLEIPFPLESVEAKAFACFESGAPIQLTMAGGTYCWTNMPFTKAEVKTDEQKQNIGKLTADVGISVNMDYSASASGAITGKIPGQLIDVFGYRQAVWLGLNDGEVNAGDSNGVQGNVLFANFDAGRPCTMSIPGHAIVADGYGFDGGLPYTHLNMGWAGSGDLWYNLPDMTEAGAEYTVVNGIGYNIFPEVGGLDDDGQTTHAVISGRVLDDDGWSVAGCAVTVRSGDAVVTNLVTDLNGIWAAILPAGVYDVEAATDDGEWIGVAEGVSLTVPETTKIDVFGSSPCAVAAAVGNSWGNDITLEHPSVRITGVERPYSSIDRAVSAARAISAESPSTPVELQILDNTILKKTQVIDFACTIMATNANPYASSVMRRDAARLEVAENGFLTVRNVVFAGADETLVVVASNGVVSVAGLVDFGVGYKTAAVETAASDGFLLASPITVGFALKCDVAHEAGECCGIGAATTMPVFQGITNCAAKIVNYFDPLGELRARVVGGPKDYALVWAELPVPLEDAVGYFLDKGGKTNTAARLDKLIADYEQAEADGRLGVVRRIVFRKGGQLSRPLTVAGNLTITGEGSPLVELGGTAGFTLTGGNLSVSGLIFSNYVGNAVFLVDGETAALAVGAGTVFTDIKGTNEWSGAVAILKGSATIGGGAIFDRCEAKGVSGSQGINAYGGAAYVAGGATLSLTGCTITNCFAANFGGAVYAAAGAEVRLSGKLQIVGNRSSNAKRDNLNLRNPSKGQPARLVLCGAVTGSVGVKWGSSTNDKFGNVSGSWLLTAEDAVYAHESAKAMFADPNDNLIAEPIEADSEAGLVWRTAPVGPQPWEGDVKQASARVTYAEGGAPVYYLLVSEALQALTRDATVEIIGRNGAYIDEDLVLTNRVTLMSDPEKGFYSFERRGDCSFKIGSGASLTLQDVIVRGCEMTNGVSSTRELLRAKPGEWTTVPVFDVAGGSLTMNTPSEADQFGTRIEHVYGDNGREAGAVHVTEGGTFAMRRGAVISDCLNRTEKASDGTGRGAAVLVDDGVADLTGGVVTNCLANNGGGVFIGSRGVVNVSGGCTIVGNSNLRGESDNLYVADRPDLVLTDTFVGKISFTPGVDADPVVFGRVAEDFAGTSEQCVSSAHNFRNDRTGDVGMVVANETERLLVWGSTLAADGTYTNASGSVYSLVSGKPVGIAVPEAVKLVYDGTEQVGVPETVGCLVSGNTATNAGVYTATVMPRPGFAWAGSGTTEAKAVEWRIEKAVYDMSGVSFANATVVYNAKPHSLAVSGELPTGVTVAYVGNGQTEIGTYTVTAKFTVGDEVNYKAIADKTAKLIIVAAENPIPPTDKPEYVTVEPWPIAFKSIERVSDTKWALVVTNRRQWAEYRLIWTENLSNGFTSTGKWEQATADGDWTTNVTFTAPVPAAIFWRAEGQPGKKLNP